MSTRTIRPLGHSFFITILFFALLLSLTLFLVTVIHPRKAHAASLAANLRPYRLVETPISTFRPARARAIDTVVVHYISGINVQPSRWDNPQLCRKILVDNRVSAHYLVDRQGAVYRLVKEKDVAWHAGGSIMPAPDNRKNVNKFSIGIETIATASSGYTPAQYQALASLITDIKSRYPIKHLLGHDQIAGARAMQLGLRRDVKADPGSQFDWEMLRKLLHAVAI